MSRTLGRWTGGPMSLKIFVRDGHAVDQRAIDVVSVSTVSSTM